MKPQDAYKYVSQGLFTALNGDIELYQALWPESDDAYMIHAAANLLGLDYDNLCSELSGTPDDEPVEPTVLMLREALPIWEKLFCPSRELVWAVRRVLRARGML